MAQGLRPATAMFVNILNEIYAPAQDFVFNYLDDSVVGSIDDEDVHFYVFLDPKEPLTRSATRGADKL